jgi:hypothetical protein
VPGEGSWTTSVAHALVQYDSEHGWRSQCISMPHVIDSSSSALYSWKGYHCMQEWQEKENPTC